MRAPHIGHAMVGGVVRVGERHRVALVEQYAEQVGQAIHGTFHREQPAVRIKLDAMHIAIPVRGRLEERRLAVERRVACIERIVHGGTGHLANELLGETVGIAFRQIDHIDAPTPCGEHLPVHALEHVRRNLRCHLGEMNGHAFSPRSRSLFRAFSLASRAIRHICPYRAWHGRKVTDSASVTQQCCVRIVNALHSKRLLHKHIKRALDFRGCAPWTYGLSG